MRHIRLFLALVLISLMTTTVLFGQTDKGKKGKPQSIGATGGVVTEGKGKVKIGATGGVIDVDKETENIKLAPPPPSMSRLAISTNAPNADVLINKQRFKTDDRGVVRKAIDLRPGPATIIVRHPDFEEKTESVVLKAGEPIVYPIKLISKYGDLKLGGIPNEAQIFIDGEEKPADALVRDGEEITINRLLVGPRKIKIVHPDYITREDEVEIKPGEQTADAKGLQLALADLTVRSISGAEIYVDDEPRGKVLPDGKVIINGIKPGERKLRVVKDGYVEAKLTEKLAVGPKEIEVKIQPLPNSGEFFDAFNSTNLNRWVAPEEWKVEGAKLVVRGSSKIGFPKGGNFRDLDAQFSMKLLNGKGAAWALHLQGEGKNYYLFYLSFPQGPSKGELRTYIVKDGKFDVKNFQNSVPTSIINFTNKDIYTIRISVRSNKIETYIKQETGAEAGAEYPLDVFIDENNLLTYGNIGFTTVDGEEVLIDDVGVKPIESADAKASAEVKPTAEIKPVSLVTPSDVVKVPAAKLPKPLFLLQCVSNRY